MNSFCAWYSFRMSFWSVPLRTARGTPVLSATATYMARRMGGGGPGRGGERLLRLVRLQEVVLERAAQDGAGHPGLVRHGDVHGEEDGGGRVDGPGGGDRTQVDGAERVLHGGQGG